MRNSIATLILFVVAGSCVAGQPAIIGHRGLFRDAPENTLASFGACIDLGLGFELDVRRTKDGTLVVLHDVKVDRTTNGSGTLAEITLDELRKLDAGSKFDPVYQDERVPTLESVFSLLRERKSKVWVAIDVKAEDASIERDVIALAKEHRVLPQLVFIGRTIGEPSVRKRLRHADAKSNVCCLAQTAKDLKAALADEHANWIYARFIPTEAEAASIRKAGKKLFLSGPPVNQHQPENFRKAIQIQADALLTDFPLECRRLWREPASGVPGKR